MPGRPGNRGNLSRSRRRVWNRGEVAPARHQSELYLAGHRRTRPCSFTKRGLTLADKPIASQPMIPRRNLPGSMVFPKSEKKRDALIDKVLKDFVDACPVLDRSNAAAVANMRESISTFSSSKLIFLELSAQQDGPLDEDAIRQYLKRMRLTHQIMDECKADRTFLFFRTWLRRGVIEATIELKALEVVNEAVSRRDEKGKPVLDAASREMSLAILSHSGWSRPTTTPINVNTFVTTPGQVDAEKRKTFDELAKLAAENEEQAAIVAAIAKGRSKAKESPLAIGLADEQMLKDVEKNG